MSRAPNVNLSRKPGAGVLVVMSAGASLRYVVASLSSGAVRVTESGNIPPADAKALETLRQKAGGAQLVQVLPPECVVVRPVAAAIKLDGSPEQVAGALNLVAEAELPTTVPAHRRCAGVLRVGQGQAVLAMAWVTDANTIPGATLVPAPAALAALHRLTGASTGLAAWSDQTSGSVVIAGCGSTDEHRVLARVLRDDATDENAWRAVVDEALADAAADLGVEPPITVSPALRLPRMPVSTFGLPAADVKTGLADFGPLLGAASLALQPKPDEQPLLTMTQRSAIVSRPIHRRIWEGMGSPRRVGVVAAVCAMVLLAGWIAAAPIQLAALRSKAGADTADYQKAMEQHDWYRVLRERRWPMTAILAELTAQAPTGITVENLTVEQNRPIALGGTAPSAEALNKWRTALRSNRVFDDVQWNSPDETSSPVRFSMSVKVAEPLLAGGAELKAIPASAPSHETASTNGREGRNSTPTRTNPPTRTTRTNGNNNSGNNNGGRTSTPAAGTPGAPAPKAEVPPPLSDSQIANLKKGPTIIEWAKRKGRMDDPALDEATRQRLHAEFEKLDERKQQLQKENP